MRKLKAPFPWFGGKSRVAHLVWERFGDVQNYVEPFAGSLAVLLGRPTFPRVETVNDVDAYLANFWRAVAAAPEEVARYADWPVNEADLHARHRWLVETATERIERVKRDAEFFDAKVAGWWVWGQCLWIGSGWCARPEWTGRAHAGAKSRGIMTDAYAIRPELSSSNGRGLISTRNGDTTEQNRRPQLTHDNGIIAEKGQHRWKKKPNLADPSGRGVHSEDMLSEKRPNLMHPAGKGVHRRWNSGGAAAGQGVHAQSLHHQIPDLGGDSGAAGRGIHASGFQLKSGGLYDYMLALQARLRRVRVCCGDWRRVLTPAVTTYIGTTAVFLDPPYSQRERSICYSHDNDVAADVCAWAIEHGNDPKFRIALCGYEGEHAMPDSWSCVAWKAGGGYGRSERGRSNRLRERIWFSPHCLEAAHPELFTA